MRTRNAPRFCITKAAPFTARMPMGVATPTTSSVSSRVRGGRFTEESSLRTIGGAGREEAPVLCLRPRPLVSAAAGVRRASVFPRVEGVPAGARAHGVRVVDREAGAHQAVDVVDLGAADVLG